ncbi:hypothetical protein MMC18_009316, partial [Xylographa bjoerkii]|nr:hypothetical protein [Xylographa bjoerkii]
TFTHNPTDLEVNPKMTHAPISPAILYFGSLVVLISTTNPDSTPNLAPLSSSFFLGHHCMLGLDASSQSTLNLLRTKQCVLNLPSEHMGSAINALALTTGTPAVPVSKISRGYQHVKDKFAAARLNPLPSEVVSPPRVKECPVHMEAQLVAVHEMMGDVEGRRGAVLGVELRVLRVWVEDGLRVEGSENRISSDKWRPMIMSFQDVYGLGVGRKVVSRLAGVEEEKYRGLTVGDAVGKGTSGEDILKEEMLEGIER